MPKKIKRALRTASLKHERKYFELGCRYIIGIDEVGRGPWAGPVAAGAVCLPLDKPELPVILKGVRDSKEMTERQREKLANTIKDVALAWGIGSATSREIDEHGIVKATRFAMRRAIVEALKGKSLKPDCLFIDDMILPEIRDIHQVSMIEGDKRSLSIAAASVVAKVWRDALMLEIDAEMPQYGFALHKGYGTAKHQAALKQYGPSPVHRMNFRPLLDLTNAEDDD